MSSKSEPLITLVVRRGALRRFHKLTQETKDLPVVVAWDRRTGDHQGTDEGADSAPPAEDRRKQQSFTWDLADFIVVPGGQAQDESKQTGETAKDAPERNTAVRR